MANTIIHYPNVTGVKQKEKESPVAGLKRMKLHHEMTSQQERTEAASLPSPQERKESTNSEDGETLMCANCQNVAEYACSRCREVGFII